MARSMHPPAMQWKVGYGTIEEDLEALRSVLGYAFYTKDQQKMGQLILLPLFQRLPLTDQEMWRGLHALIMGDQAQGSAKLEKAAAPDKPGICYVLCNLYVACAQETQRMHLLAQAQRYREQAAKYFDLALQVHAHAEDLNVIQQRPWFAWNEPLALLSSGK